MPLPRPEQALQCVRRQPPDQVTAPMQRTPLHAVAQASGAVMGQWQGWELPLSYGDSEAEYAAAQTAAVLYDASTMGRLRVTGADGLDLLNRLSTNAVEGLAIGQGADTILTDDRGRIIDLITVLRLDQWVLLLTSPGQQQQIVQWLDKYTIIEDIEVEDVTEATAMLGMAGPGAGSIVDAVAGLASSELPSCGAVSLAESCHLLHRSLGGLPNFYLMGPGPAIAQMWQDSLNAGATPMGQEACHALRVKLGLPAHGSELGDAYNPLEAGLMGAISFTKGCYIGQEVIARLDTYQKVQRRLVSLQFSGDSALGVTPGARLMLDDREVGVVTSISPIAANGGTLGMGYVRTAAAEAGASLSLKETGQSASIEALLEPLGPVD